MESGSKLPLSGVFTFLGARASSPLYSEAGCGLEASCPDRQVCVFPARCSADQQERATAARKQASSANLLSKVCGSKSSIPTYPRVRAADLPSRSALLAVVKWAEPSQVGRGLSWRVEFNKEEIMSARNGDKARFGRLRKRKILLRKRIREIRDAMQSTTARAASSASK